MARSIDAPFRREFNITSTGNVGDAGGFYVGDIKTLYINIEPTNTAKGFIQGKIGRSGDWFNVPFTLEAGRSGAVDISGIEYVRFIANVVTKPTYLIMFGYYEKDTEKPVEIKLNTQDLDREIETINTLCEIKNTLHKINFHLKLITGEDDE